MNSIGIEFLKIDVQTALTFAGLALDTEDQEKKDRNRGNARKAYETILCLWKTVHFTPAEEAYMKKMMGRLKNELGELGETF